MELSLKFLLYSGVLVVIVLSGMFLRFSLLMISVVSFCFSVFIMCVGRWFMVVGGVWKW